MKIFHTADWHLGKIVNGFSMLEDQKYVLDNLINNLKMNNIDVLIISGDIYDRSIPSQEAIKLLDDTLYQIVSELKIKILIIPGNHDGAQRLSFANKLYANSGLFIVGDFDKKIPKITFSDEYGPVNFYLLPYFNPTEIANMFEHEQKTDNENSKTTNINTNIDVNIKTFSQAFSAIIEHNKQYIDISERNILVAHGFFGCLNQENNLFYDQITSPSELSVGGMDIIDISCASFFDYIALGHLHAPQTIKNQFFRYSGSLLKYSVDEAKQEKSCVFLEMKEKNQFEIKLEKLKILRDLRVVTGYIKELCESHDSVKLVSDDYVFVNLLDEDIVYDCVARLRQTFKNIIGVKMINRLSKDNNITIDKIKTKDLKTLFNNFYTAVSNQQLDPEKQNIISEILLSIQNNSPNNIQNNNSAL